MAKTKQIEKKLDGAAVGGGSKEKKSATAPAFRRKKNNHKTQNKPAAKNSAAEIKTDPEKEAEKVSDKKQKPSKVAQKSAAQKKNGQSASYHTPAKDVKNTKDAKNAKNTKNTKNTKNAKNGKSEGAKQSPRVKIEKNDNATVRIIPLGGLHEIGKNMTAIECGDDIIVVDCGLAFPDDEMPGVDLVIPDVTYLEANASRVRGLVLTHGHEDHIGAIPYVLRNINPPIYGTKLTLGIVRNKLKEFKLPVAPTLNCVEAGDTVRLGGMAVEFIHVNHSIADACALAIFTPLGTIVHSGDFKLDLTPIDGEIMDITRLGELGREGVLLLMCESTNAERPGYTPSERKVGASLEYIFTTHKEQRIVIATFSSNVHRVQQIIDTAARHGRKVAVTGRSMLNIVGAAVELGYMQIPEGVLIDISEMSSYNPEQITLVTTGSQGEPMSALYRMAFGEHRDVRLDMNDVVVISSSPIPGNEKLVGRIVNELCKVGVEVIRDSSVEVHVSGHACQEEIKLMLALTRPKYYMPVHGEYKHLAANRALALSMGIESQNIFVSDIGNVLEIDRRGAKIDGTVNAGRVLVDGYGVGDVGNIVLRDRLLLSQDGLIVVVATVSSDGGYLLSGPDIVSRGFIYVRESEEFMEELRRVAYASIECCLNSRSRSDWYQIKGKVKEDMTKFIFAKTRRRPMIIPMIMNV
ncbi:MAG: RNase J family beta-CASP ribonuclease [Clostridia bacterium]|nr:RNase J family beta-CASP ribonuclease [Clostridia bacterium]